MATVDLKRHDLCLQLRSANQALYATVQELPELLQRADTSRQRINAAEGMLRSGAAEMWRQQVAESEQQIQALRQRLPRDGRFESMTLGELGGLILATQELQGRADALRALLLEELQKDDYRRDQRRQDTRAFTAVRLSQGGQDPRR